MKICMIAAFWAVLGAVSIMSFTGKDQKFSENENRYLAELPEISWERVVSGEFQRELETYLNDQICFRDSWITIKTGIQKACGDTDIGGAYVGKDGYDFEKITPEDVDRKLFSRNISEVKNYFDYCSGQGMEPSRLSFLLVPTSGLVLPEKLPPYARMFDQTSCIEQVQQGMGDYSFIDVRDAFAASKDRQLYYRTDHHWTSHGAFVAYEQWCKAAGYDCGGADAYDVTTVTEEFRGSLYSKILDHDSAWDSICVYKKKDSAAFRITKDGVPAVGFYDEAKLGEKDKYGYFFGGNYGEVIIENEDGGEGNLLVVKDSFANSFVPFLAENYRNVYMVDLRYYKGNMKTYLQEKEITDVLVLYNISNFISDKNIFLLNR